MRLSKISLALLAAAAVFSLTGCNEKPGSKVLAKVNGVPLTEEDLKFQPKDSHGTKTKQEQYGAKNITDIINQELLSQQGVRLGLDQDPSYRLKLDAFSRQPAGAKRLEMARRVFNTQIASRIEVKPEEAKAFFDKNGDLMATEVHLLMAKFPTRSEAEAAQKKLRGGADFSSITSPAVKSVALKGKEESSDLGFLKWQQIPVDFLEPIYRLKPGEVSEPLGTHRTGFQIVKLIEKRKAPEQKYEVVSALVINRLRDLKLLNAYNQYLETLRKGATIVTF